MSPGPSAAAGQHSASLSGSNGASTGAKVSLYPGENWINMKLVLVSVNEFGSYDVCIHPELPDL